MKALQLIQDNLKDCQRCKLHQERTNIVFGEGNPQAKVVFLGEGPGFHEDRTGRPFVGPAGQLLDKMIAAMGLKRQDVYITNVVKCRPPNNRTPEPDEIKACGNHFRNELLAVHPKIIVLLGKTAVKTYLGLDMQFSIANTHGLFKDLPPVDTNDNRYRPGIIITYHPAALLRNEELKKTTWSDLQIAMKFLRENNEQES